MKGFFLKAAATALCFFATIGLAVAEESSHRLLDPLLLKSVDQALINRQQAEIEKKYPKMFYKPDMMANMMGEMTLQQSMQGAVQPAMMNIMNMMTMGMFAEENGKDQQNELLGAMNKLGQQVVKIQQDAMNEMHAQAPMQNQVREGIPDKMAGSQFLQTIFRPRQQARTIGEFHAGTFVRTQMNTKPVPLPGTELVHLQLHPKKAEGERSN